MEAKHSEEAEEVVPARAELLSLRDSYSKTRSDINHVRVGLIFILGALTICYRYETQILLQVYSFLADFGAQLRLCKLPFCMAMGVTAP